MIHYQRRFDPSRITLLIFDLDGTLIDSRLDLIHAVNAMLRHLGRDALAGEVIASYVGDGAPALVRRSLGSDEGEEGFQAALDFFLAYYRVHKLDHTQPYEGVREALLALRTLARAPQMAVLSNKPVNPSRDILEALGLGEFFTQVYGGNSFTSKKPDPLGAQTLLAETGTAPENAIIIGDSAIDVLTGRNAGLWTCGVTYGFAPQSLLGTPPDVLLDSPHELAALFSARDGDSAG